MHFSFNFFELLTPNKCGVSAVKTDYQSFHQLFHTRSTLDIIFLSEFFENMSSLPIANFRLHRDSPRFFILKKNADSSFRVWIFWKSLSNFSAHRLAPFTKTSISSYGERHPTLTDDVFLCYVSDKSFPSWISQQHLVIEWNEIHCLIVTLTSTT